MSNTEYTPSYLNKEANDFSSHEIKVNPIENSKRLMYIAKMSLIKNDNIELIAGTGGSPAAVRAAESLVRLGYVEYESIKTDTTLSNTGKRRTKLTIKLKKNADFQKLFDENEEIRRKTQEIEKS